MFVSIAELTKIHAKTTNRHKKSHEILSIHVKTMQKRPAALNPFSYLSIPFPSDFPLNDAELLCHYRFIGSNLTKPHIHECFEIGYCHKGKGVFKIADKTLPFRSRDISIINNTEVHIAYYYVDCDWTWLYFDPIKMLIQNTSDTSLLETGRFGGPDFNNIFSGKEHPIAEDLFLNIFRELERKEKHYKDAVRGLLLAFMACLQRMDEPEKKNRDDQNNPRSDTEAIKRIGPAIDYIHSNFSKRISIEELANKVFMSSTNFRRIFTKAIGASPHEYLTAFRINVASAELKRTTKNIETIAYDAGFEDPSAFHRAFKHGFGCAPGEWRKTQG